MSLTLMDALSHNVDKRPSAIACVWKDAGIWHEWTWRELVQDVAHRAALLSDSGVKSGDRIAVSADHSPFFASGLLALVALEAVPIIMHYEISPPQLGRVLKDAEVAGVVVGNPGLAQRLSTEHSTTNVVMTCEALIEAPPGADGASLPDAAVIMIGFVDRETETAPRFLKDSDVFSFVDTLGVQSDDQLMVSSPVASPAGFSAVYGTWVATGASLAFPENPQTAPVDREEAAPTVYVSAGKEFDRIFERVVAASHRADGRAAMLRRLLIANDKGVRFGLLDRLICARPLRHQIGFGRCRRLFWTGDPPSKRTRQFFQALGLEFQPAEATLRSNPDRIDVAATEYLRDAWIAPSQDKTHDALVVLSPVLATHIPGADDGKNRSFSEVAASPAVVSHVRRALSAQPRAIQRFGILARQLEFTRGEIDADRNVLIDGVSTSIGERDVVYHEVGA